MMRFVLQRILGPCKHPVAPSHTRQTIFTGLFSIVAKDGLDSFLEFHIFLLSAGEGLV
jgi:hypothetical protein